MDYFENILKNSDRFKRIEKAAKANKYPIQINGSVDTQVCHMMTILASDKDLRLIVTYSEERARKLYNDLHAFDKNVLYYPAKDALFFSADVHGAVTQRQRLMVIKEMLVNRSATVVTTIDGGLDRVLPLEVFEEFSIRLKAEEKVDFTEFAGKLVELGYEKNYQVEGPGQYSIRGGILDIFPMGEENPVRIELWDDEIDTIRSFDVESQRSIEKLDELVIFPATEMPLSEATKFNGKEAIEADFDIAYKSFLDNHKTSEAYHLKDSISQILDQLENNRLEAGIDSFISYFYDETISLIDYFSSENAVIFYDEPSWILETLHSKYEEFETSMKGRLKQGYILEGQIKVYFHEEEIKDKIRQFSSYYFSRIGYENKELIPAFSEEIRVQRTNTYHNHMDILIKDMRAWQKEGYRVLFLSASSTRGQRLAKELEENAIDAYYAKEPKDEVAVGKTLVTFGSISTGFVYLDEKLAILSEDDIIRSKRKKKKNIAPRYKGEVIKNFDDLSVGDYVVHEDRGVGIYRGIVSKTYDDTVSDYISIEYADKVMYYINIRGMHKVQRYAGAEGSKPKLSKIGGTDWERTKSKVMKQVGEVAKELVELYAIRMEKTGFSCDPDTPWQNEFEEMFPFEETDDQLKAIDEVKRDMESTRIMDRLLCGDVGYGKTEVALRAAFKAVNNSKQVVYLVPTTVLCEQHFQTFTERMKDYPIRIEMLSRFRTPKQVKETLKGLEKGEVDIVIGTHRVFSKDVKYKNLGLLIIDEEQRFGVTHKEKIKQMKKEVDVLTLTATPIPRTLHMSLSGIRDMSLLSEPPVNRRAIQTYVMDYNDELVKEAIKRELARGGQVYYVYNRVKNIEDIAEGLRELVPQAHIAAAHGRMGEHELENIMHSFIKGEIDVLVSTTIIETGIDIPNVNTIIIQNADAFGLSQLYQLRGRVGRSSRQAYAFLLYRRDKLLRETAEKRLAAIKEFTDLGSGFKIAMRDLEIRGAGNVLGEEQSGQMQAVGYDLYCKMLKNAIAEMKGEKAKELIDTAVDVKISAYIPSSYVGSEFQKLELYKRIANIASLDDLEDMLDELVDRYGEPPLEVKNLLDISLVKSEATERYITKFNYESGTIIVTFHNSAPLDIAKVDETFKRISGRIKISDKKIPSLIFNVGHLKDEEIIPKMKETLAIVDDMFTCA
ncbi:MAG: transcription-repair coupling factor [Lachnospiraceae bacterium]|nr:transcription-repair coupling factor [Lachnospiraceae bacterium]